MKIAFDENVPLGMVRVFQTFAHERQLRKLTGNFEIKSAKDYTPRPGDADYVPGSDVPWLKRFADDDGKVVVSGNTQMRSVSHERLALIDCGFIVIFFESQWSNWKFFRKCALLLHWWPEIAKKIKKAKRGSFWHVPCNWAEDGKLRKVSNKDPHLERIERRKRAKRKRPKKPSAPLGDGPLFDHARKIEKARDATETSDAENASTDGPESGQEVQTIGKGS